MAETLHCPACELRFARRTELEDHLRTDHVAAVRDDVPEPVAAPTGVVTIPLDPARPPGTAFLVGAAVARQAGMAVELVAAPSPGLPTAPYLTARAHELAASRTLALPWRELRAGDPAEAIVEHLAQRRPDVVCLATRARTAIGEALFGSVSEAIVRRSPVPVLLVGPWTLVPPRVDRVVACVDGTTVAEDAAGSAAAFANRLGAELRLLEVQAPRPGGGQALETLYLHKLATRLSVPEHRQVTITGTRLADAIVHYVEGEKGAVLVLGTAARNGFDAWALGSVAMDVVRHAPCPVLVVTSVAAQAASTADTSATG
jgi:nucleotide-binding universal stress UspA family protein